MLLAIFKMRLVLTFIFSFFICYPKHLNTSKGPNIVTKDISYTKKELEVVWKGNLRSISHNRRREACELDCLSNIVIVIISPCMLYATPRK